MVTDPAFSGRPLVVFDDMRDSFPKILVVDDDPGMRELLDEYLSGQGFQVTSVPDGPAMRNCLAENEFDLAILDVMLPGEDGLSLARRLRSTTRLPIIMLSARGEDVDRIIGLEVGADDYLAKPFNPRELLARVRAVLRRGSEDEKSDGAQTAGYLAIGPMRLNLRSRRLTLNGADVPLTSGDFELLKVFAAHPNHLLSRDQLMDLVRGHDRHPFDRSIDVRVTRLRRKIEPDPANPIYIRTIWGRGYLFSPDGSEI